MPRLLKTIIFCLSFLTLLFASSISVYSQPICLGTLTCHMETSANNCQANEVFCKGASDDPRNVPYFCCPPNKILQPLTNSSSQPPTTTTTSTSGLSTPSISTGTQNRHPLRPKPNEITGWEKNRPVANYTQTLFCAQRPTAVQKQEFLKTDPQLDLQITGTYLSNFEEFITPLLSITNKDKDDYRLSYEEKAQQYLADYLGGRAYYELFPESPTNPTYLDQAQQSNALTPDEVALIQLYGLDNIPNLETQNIIKAKLMSGFTYPRVGVFRKLAPQVIQDKYKRAMIYRVTGIPAAENPSGLDPLDFLTSYYSFEPASPIVANYPITCWNNSRNEIVAFTQYNNFKNPCGKNKNIRLGSFDETNWAPIPEEFKNKEDYQQAYNAWLIKDGGQIIYDPDCDPQGIQACPIIAIQPGKWAKIWPYVPMFSREDLQGYIRAVSPDADPEINPVKHPHLARTYELSSALSTLLLPKNDFDFDSDPNLETSWNGIPWCNLDDKDCKKWWIDSSDTMPQLPLGPVCDPLNTIITSSGDSAYDSSFTTPVNSPTQIINNPEYSQAVVRRCNLLAINDPVAYEKECKFKHDVRYSPDYFVTRTPYLNQITNRLVSEMGIFNILRPQQDIINNQPVNWPGLGNPEEITPMYSFIGGGAEAGMKQPGSLVEFYYKGLGFIHCQKEKVLAILQPFITGRPYQYLSPECTQDSTPSGLGQPSQYADKELYGPPPNIPSASTCSDGVDPVGRWLIWPYKSSSPPPITSCYKDPSRKSCHAGIDMDPGDDAPIYPGASGKVHYANGAPKGCAEFGACVIIDHCNGWFTIYAHLVDFEDNKFVEIGQSVTTNTQIGIQDNTGRSSGSHLHWGLAYGGNISDFWYSRKKTANICKYTEGCSCTSSNKCR